MEENMRTVKELSDMTGISSIGGLYYVPAHDISYNNSRTVLLLGVCHFTTTRRIIPQAAITPP